jgi:two-component system, LytTR family, response regulator LytT
VTRASDVRTGDELAILAVDDERPALHDLARMLRRLPEVGTVEGASSGSEALRALNGRPFDAVFIDVRMPDLDGIELARVLRRFDRPPPLVFVSAYESGAVDAFEVEALDYLMKPVSRKELERAITRVTAQLESRNGKPAPANEPARAGGDDDRLVAVDGPRGRTRLLSRGSVLYLQAQGDYVRIVSDDGRYLLRGRISEIERAWEEHGFARIHRSYIANLHRAIEVRPQLNGTATLVLGGGVELPIARRKIATLRSRLHI